MRNTNTTQKNVKSKQELTVESRLKYFICSIAFKGSDGLRLNNLNDIYEDTIIRDEEPCKFFDEKSRYSCEPTPFLISACLTRNLKRHLEPGGGPPSASPSPQKKRPIYRNRATNRNNVVVRDYPRVQQTNMADTQHQQNNITQSYPSHHPQQQQQHNNSKNQIPDGYSLIPHISCGDLIELKKLLLLGNHQHGGHIGNRIPIVLPVNMSDNGTTSKEQHAAYKEFVQQANAASTSFQHNMQTRIDNRMPKELGNLKATTFTKLTAEQSEFIAAIAEKINNEQSGGNPSEVLITQKPDASLSAKKVKLETEIITDFVTPESKDLVNVIESTVTNCKVVDSQKSVVVVGSPKKKNLNSLEQSLLEYNRSKAEQKTKSSPDDNRNKDVIVKVTSKSNVEEME